MPKVHRCAERGCREMISLGFRYCEKHYQQHYNQYLKQQTTRQAAEGYRYHKLRKARYYDKHVRFNNDEEEDKNNALKDLYKSFGIKNGDKKPAKNDGKVREQSSRAKFYRSKQWHAVRESIVNRDMNCCQVCGRSMPRMFVDHIIPLQCCTDDQMIASENLWTLCGGCHNRKTKAEARMTIDELQRYTIIQWKSKLQQSPRP